MVKKSAKSATKPKQKPLTKLVGCGVEPAEIYMLYWRSNYTWLNIQGKPTTGWGMGHTYKYLGRQLQHYKRTNPQVQACRQCQHVQRKYVCGEYHKWGRKYLCGTCLAANGIVW